MITKLLMSSLSGQSVLKGAAASTAIGLPMFVTFAILSQYFIQGMSASAFKG
jgi:ABC-type maltose transport system permease subunit